MTTQPLDNRDTIEQVLINYLTEERRTLMSRIKAIDVILWQLNPKMTKAERERAAYEARQAGR